MGILTKLFTATILSAGLLSAAPYELDTKHSNVGFSVKHLMITNVKGDFNEYSAKIDFDKDTKVFNKLVATVKTASIDTGIEKRDKHLRSADFFLSEEYPNMTFTMHDYNKQNKEIKGDLTIRGITKAITLKVEDLATIKDLQGNTRVGFTLRGEINRTNFGLKWNKALEFGGIAVGENVKIIVDVQAKKK